MRRSVNPGFTLNVPLRRGAAKLPRGSLSILRPSVRRRSREHGAGPWLVEWTVGGAVFLVSWLVAWFFLAVVLNPFFARYPDRAAGNAWWIPALAAFLVLDLFLLVWLWRRRLIHRPRGRRWSRFGGSVRARGWKCSETGVQEVQRTSPDVVGRAVLRAARAGCGFVFQAE